MFLSWSCFINNYTLPLILLNATTQVSLGIPSEVVLLEFDQNIIF